MLMAYFMWKQHIIKCSEATCYGLDLKCPRSLCSEVTFGKVTGSGVVMHIMPPPVCHSVCGQEAHLSGWEGPVRPWPPLSLTPSCSWLPPACFALLTHTRFLLGAVNHALRLSKWGAGLLSPPLHQTGLRYFVPGVEIPRSFPSSKDIVTFGFSFVFWWKSNFKSVL